MSWIEKPLPKVRGNAQWPRSFQSGLWVGWDLCCKWITGQFLPLSNLASAPPFHRCWYWQHPIIPFQHANLHFQVCFLGELDLWLLDINTMSATSQQNNLVCLKDSEYQEFACRGRQIWTRTGPYDQVCTRSNGFTMELWQLCTLPT